MNQHEKPAAAPREEADFTERHADDLSASRFVKVKGLEMFIPIATAAVGGVIGYFTLGTPLKKMFPKTFGWSNTALNVFGSAREAISQLRTVAPELLARAGEITHDTEGLRKLSSLASPEEIRSIEEALKKTQKDRPLSNIVGAGALAIVGSTVGSVFVGYDKWRKEESTRLAASEIDRDISRLELFKPSDPELVAENKRLRGMLAEAEQKKPTAPHHAMPTIHKEEAEHHGRATHHAEHQIA